MFISGLLLLGSDYSYFPYVVPTEELTGLELGTGRYDSIYASRSTAMPLIDPPSLIWDTDTVFCADYEKSINAGNIDFSLSTISQLAVRRRKYGTFNWTTVCVRNIDSKEDLQFAGIDLFNAGNTDYEYALVPILNGAEGNYYIVSVHSDLTAYTFLIKTECSVQLLISNAALPERIPLYARHHFVTDIRAQYTILRSITIPAQLKHFSADMIRHGMPSIPIIPAHTGTS